MSVGAWVEVRSKQWRAYRAGLEVWAMPHPTVTDLWNWYAGDRMGHAPTLTEAKRRATLAADGVIQGRKVTP